jgi:cytochrome oxidase Cu insertion factor (SCO1/SenC/PrrC family)
MKKKVYSLQFIVYSLIFALSLGCFINISCAQKEGLGTNKAPDFTLTDVNGKEVNLHKTVAEHSAGALIAGRRSRN